MTRDPSNHKERQLAMNAAAKLLDNEVARRHELLIAGLEGKGRGFADSNPIGLRPLKLPPSPCH